MRTEQRIKHNDKIRLQNQFLKSLNCNEYKNCHLLLRTFDDEAIHDEPEESHAFNENLLSSLSQGAGINDISNDPSTNQEKLFRSTSCKSPTPSRYNVHSFEMDNPSFESTTGTAEEYYHNSLDQGKA